jgi:hypothetical protein
VDTPPTTGGNTDSSSNATTNATDDIASPTTSPDASTGGDESSSTTGVIVAIVLVLMLILFGLLFLYMRTQKQAEAGAAAAVQFGGNGLHVDNPTYNANAQGGAGVYGGDTNYDRAQDDGAGVYGGDTNYGQGTTHTARHMTAQLGDRSRSSGTHTSNAGGTNRRTSTGGGAPIRVVQMYGGGGDAMPYSDAAAGRNSAHITLPRSGTSNSVTYAIPFEGPYNNGQYEEVAQGGGTGTGARARVYTDADIARMANDVQYDAVQSSSNRGNNMVYAVSPNDVRCFVLNHIFFRSRSRERECVYFLSRSSHPSDQSLLLLWHGITTHVLQAGTVPGNFEFGAGSGTVVSGGGGHIQESVYTGNTGVYGTNAGTGVYGAGVNTSVYDNATNNGSTSSMRVMAVADGTGYNRAHHTNPRQKAHIHTDERGTVLAYFLSW